MFKRTYISRAVRWALQDLRGEWRHKQSLLCTTGATTPPTPQSVGVCPTGARKSEEAPAAAPPTSVSLPTGFDVAVDVKRA